jgi:predicted DNA-binding transcriptional regulator AlpA
MKPLDPALAEQLAPFFEHFTAYLRQSAGTSTNGLALLGGAEGCHDVAAAPKRAKKIMTNSTLLTARQVGEMLQLDARTVRQRWREGTIPGAIHVGKSVRWRRRDLEKWIEEQVAR